MLAGLRVDRLEPAVHRPVERHVARGHDGAAPHRQFFRNAPYLLVVDDIPCEELAALATGAGVHLHVGADVGRSLDVAHLEAFHVHAKVLMRHVQKAGTRRVRRWLPILGARRGRTDFPHDFSGDRLFRLHQLRTAGLQIDARHRVGVRERLGRKHLACLAIDHVHVAVALGMNKYLACLTLDRQIEHEVLVDAVVIEKIVRVVLIRPHRFAGFRASREDGARPLVVAGPEARIPGAGIRRAVEDEVELGVV